jgi:hypothetical protein
MVTYGLVLMQDMTGRPSVLYFLKPLKQSDALRVVQCNHIIPCMFLCNVFESSRWCGDREVCAEKDLNTRIHPS